jgi:hypothetical protein
MLHRTLISSGLLLLTLTGQSQIQPSPEKLRQHVSLLASDSLLGRGFGTAQGAEAATYIAAQFLEAGIEPLDGTYFHPFNHRQGILNISGINVVGIIPGSDPLLSREYIILGAHFDHLGWKIEEGDTVVYNGADDNASGTASIIEIGRSLVANKERLGRSIILVAFDGEESGLIGSGRFVKDTLVPLHQIKLMLSLDMVGMYGAHGGVDLHGVNQLTSPELLIEELSRAHEVNIRKANGRKPQRTDTAPFGNLKIPAIHVFTGTESPYHRPEDESGQLDYEGMAKIAVFITDATIQLSLVKKISDLPGPGEDGGAREEIFSAGIRINTGSGRHNYKDAYYKGKSVFAFEAGVFANIRVTDFLAIQPELLYETTGSRHQEGKFRTHAVTLPLNLQLNLAEQSMVRTFLQAGGYYSFNFGGKLGGDPIDYEEAFTPHEFGFTYGVGLEAMGIQMGMYVKRGLSSIVREPGSDTGDILSQGVYFMLGITF